MSAFIYINPDAPESYAIDLVPGTSGVDLSTVTAASFAVRKPGNVDVTWTAAMTNPSPTTLTLTHVFASGDVDIKGTYLLYAVLTVPSGVLRTATDTFVAKGEYEL